MQASGKAHGSVSCWVKFDGLRFVLCTMLIDAGHIGLLDSEMNDKEVSLSQVPTVWHKTRLAFKGSALWLPAAVLCHLQRTSRAARGVELGVGSGWRGLLRGFSQDTNESLFTPGRAPRTDQSSSASQ